MPRGKKKKVRISLHQDHYIGTVWQQPLSQSQKQSANVTVFVDGITDMWTTGISVEYCISHNEHSLLY